MMTMAYGRWLSKPRLFSTRTEERRFRRQSDALTLVTCIVAIAIASLVATPPARFETDLVRVIEALPSGLSGLWRIMVELLRILALVLVGAALVRRRWALLRDMVLSFLLVVGGGLIVGRLAQGSWQLVWNIPLDLETARGMPWLQLGATTAVTAVAMPHLARWMRQLATWLIVLAVISASLLGAILPTQAFATLVLGVGSAAAVHLIFGSTRGRPDLEDIEAALGMLGVEASELEIADRQPAGVFMLVARGPDRGILDVKVYGNDAYDTRLLSKFWRTVWFREPGAPSSSGRLEQVQKKAFLTLLAGQSGVPVQPVVTAASTPGEDAVLILERMGSAMPPAEEGWGPGDVERLWDLIAVLGEANIAHNQIDDAHTFVADDGRMGLVDFSGATLATDPWWRRIDQVQAFIVSAVVLGVGPAVEVADRKLGRDHLLGVLPYLQADMLTPRHRQLLTDAEIDMDDLRAEAAELLGVEPPELEQIRRVTFGSLLRMALPVLAFLALSSVFAGLDLEDLASALSGASWWFVGVGVLVGQLPRLSQAVSAMGASPIPVPLGRLYLLQLAQSFLALTVPGAAARVAINVRFFQRHGLTSGSALTVGAIDGFFGFFVQLILLGSILGLTSATLDLDLDGDVSAGLARLLVVVTVIVAGLIAVILTVPPLRTRVTQWVGRFWTEAISALRGLASPSRLGFLFGGNLATELFFALALGALTVAFGYPIGLGELIFIHVAVSLFSGLMPIPGGIGVFEAGMTFGLVRAGMPDDVAFATALLFRMVTFYIPPLWGAAAFRWLEKNKHL
jgi:glycosyltransferase 2 family protein